MIQKLYIGDVFVSGSKPFNVWLRLRETSGTDAGPFDVTTGTYEWTLKTDDGDSPSPGAKWTNITDNAMSAGVGSPVTYSQIIPGGFRIGSLSKPPTENERIEMSWQDIANGKAVSFLLVGNLANDPSRPFVGMNGMMQQGAARTMYVVQAPQHHQQQMQHGSAGAKYMIAAAPQGGQCGSGAQMLMQHSIPNTPQVFAIRQAAPQTVARPSAGCNCTSAGFM